MFNFSSSTVKMHDLKLKFNQSNHLLSFPPLCSLLQERDKRRDVDLSGETVQDVAALLVAFLDELKEPIFPLAIYDELISLKSN